MFVLMLVQFACFYRYILYCVYVICYVSGVSLGVSFGVNLLQSRFWSQFRGQFWGQFAKIKFCKVSLPKSVCIFVRLQNSVWSQFWVSCIFGSA